MALSVKVGKGKDRRYVPIDLGRRGRQMRMENIASCSMMSTSGVHNPHPDSCPAEVMKGTARKLSYKLQAL